MSKGALLRWITQLSRMINSGSRKKKTEKSKTDPKTKLLPIFRMLGTT